MKFKIRLIIFLLSITYTSAQEVITYTAVFLSKNSTIDTYSESEYQKIENEHLRSIGRLSDSGILVNGGPFEGGGELLILGTKDRKETDFWLEKDPANIIYNAEIMSFQLRYGKICEPAIPYEMETYTLIRYQPTNQIARYKSNSDFNMRSGHDDHIKKLIQSGQVIAEGIFGGNDGGLIIYKKDALNKTVQKDPAIVEGYMITTQKTIWLNKGSFCNL